MAVLDAQSALMLVCTKFRHAEQSNWGKKTYLNIQRLEELHPSEIYMCKKKHARCRSYIYDYRN